MAPYSSTRLENPMDRGAWWAPHPASGEPGVSGALGGRWKAVRDRFALQGGTGDEGKLGVALESLQGLRDLT